MNYYNKKIYDYNTSLKPFWEKTNADYLTEIYNGDKTTYELYTEQHISTLFKMREREFKKQLQEQTKKDTLDYLISFKDILAKAIYDRLTMLLG